MTCAVSTSHGGQPIPSCVDHSIGAGAYTPVYSGIFYISAECDPDKRASAEEAMLAQVAAVQDAGVSEREVHRAGRMFLADQLGGVSTMRDPVE